MRILYVFPHPDDESFGPARAISAQVRAGHAIHLLTLTRGGATKERHRLGLTIEQMGLVRCEEMRNAARVLGLSDLTVLDFPDSGLKELDPRVLEAVAADHVENVRPDVLVTYPIHGISGFHDHLVTHAIVKRVFVEAREHAEAPPKRLALFTLTREQAEKGSREHRLSGSTDAEIDCLMTVEAEDVETNRRALDCYMTYQEMIEKTGIKDSIDRIVAFELFGESFDPPITDLCADLPRS